MSDIKNEVLTVDSVVAEISEEMDLYEQYKHEDNDIEKTNNNTNIDQDKRSITPEMEKNLTDSERYELNLLKFRSKIANDKGKFNLIIAALDKEDILTQHLETGLKKVINKQGESDFHIISLIRLLYLGNDHIPIIAEAKHKIESSLKVFPFWPHWNKSNPDFDKIVFWSENHLFMTLGSCYLYNQYILNPTAKDANIDTKNIIINELNKKLETKLLKIYLRAHCKSEFNGIYEVNSSVYLPYTLSGLFNIYDFTIDDEIKTMAEHIINRVIFHIMLCTTSHGISNLSAGGRTFIRTRLRTHGHNINKLMNILIGKSPDEFNPSAITDFLLTTTWKPNFIEIKKALEYTGTHPTLHLSHNVNITRQLYTSLAEVEEVNIDELIPFYWSAGLVTHPDYVYDTRVYLNNKGMNKNENLSALAFLSPSVLQGRMHNYSTVSKGQMYTDLKLNVFKHPKQQLVLSSFENFNPHCSSFQQLPWIANISGVGVWSQSGKGSESLFNFGMTNTHNPVITQKGSVLIASYCTPSSLRNRMIMGTLFSGSVRLYWPVQFFSEWYCWVAPSENHFVSVNTPVVENKFVFHNTLLKLNEVVQKPKSWCAGQRGDCYIAVYCSEKSKMDHRVAKDAEMKETSTAQGVHVSRRVCNEYRHSWVTVVGSTLQYPTLKDFINDRCMTMNITERNGGSSWFPIENKYDFKVVDAVEGALQNTVALPI